LSSEVSVGTSKNVHTHTHTPRYRKKEILYGMHWRKIPDFSRFPDGTSVCSPKFGTGEWKSVLEFMMKRII
jgi:hypothetical protein